MPNKHLKPHHNIKESMFIFSFVLNFVAPVPSLTFGIIVVSEVSDRPYNKHLKPHHNIKEFMFMFIFVASEARETISKGIHFPCYTQSSTFPITLMETRLNQTEVQLAQSEKEKTSILIRLKKLED